MKEVVIRIIPADVIPDDFEDLLATDSLFVEYFNAFLQLPTFPEPLCFNKENGGFEVVSSAKKELANAIKAAIRSGQRRKKIYRPVHSHSFRNIPLIPMEDQIDSGDKEIDTSFAVRTLNKEQGIQWVKRERLPLFLESDFYLEYRLAKLVSQVPGIGERGESANIKLDYTPHIRQLEEEEEEEEPPEDETELMMRNLYVCMGKAGTTDTEAWVSQAKIAMETDTTASTSTRPTSAMAHNMTRPISARPVSARSNPGSSGLRLDSGIWSASKMTSSLYGGSMLDDVSQYTQSMFGTTTASEDQDDIPLGGDLFHPNLKHQQHHQPAMPRPSDQVCAVSVTRPTALVYTRPHPPPPHVIKPHRATTTPLEAEQEDQGIGDDSSISTETSISSMKDMQEAPKVQLLVFKDIDQFAEVIVCSALKSAIAEVTGQSVAEVSQNSQLLRPMFEESEKFVGWNKDHVECVIGVPTKAPEPDDVIEVEVAESVDEGSAQTIIGDKESDEDSVLNSDEDYEDERDDFFRKTKGKPTVDPVEFPAWIEMTKTYSLGNVKGISAFKKFLIGCPGEKNWLFWMDIERAKFITDETQLTNFLLAMRERYQKHGAPYELSKETKNQLGLTEPSHWTLDRLITVQNAMTEPLVLYWAPRFLMKQKVKIYPEQNLLYNQQKKMKTKPDPFPSPSVVSLLPLRPKTCLPRRMVETPRESLKIADALEGVCNEDEPKAKAPVKENLPQTTPPVGMKRTYCLSDEFLTTTMKKERDTANQPPLKLKQKTPRQLLTPKLKTERLNRPASAPAHLHQPKANRKDPWDVHSSISEEDVVRPSTSRRSSTATTNSVDSEFTGGRRMEGLLQALANEKKSGGVLRKFLRHVGNQLWKNCLDFWEELQGYHSLFYSEVLDPWMLKQKAKFLYSKYVVLGASKSIQCSTQIRDSVYYKLDPPFEELFDDAEEYVLSILFDAWSQMINSDITTFSKVELIEVKRHLDAKSKYVMSLRRRGILKERVETPEESMEGYEDPVYDEALWEKLATEFREWNLDKLVHNRLELENFKNYLAENYASMDLMCWVDIEAFRRIPHVEEKRRDIKAKDIKVKYFTKKYFFGPNSPAGKAGQEKVMQAGGGWGKLLKDRPPTSSLLEAQKYVRERLEKNWLPRFLATDEFQERQRPRVGMDDAVEDVLIQKKKKSQAIWRMIESKWVSSSKDIMTFRKALMNPVTSHQFRKFVSIKGDNFENDVLFYQEVQRYKDMCHIHSERSLVQQKTLAIIACFIDSPIPPALQIDVTQETADKIIDRSKDATPYLFRESQLTVFRVLFSHWSDFCTFRSNLTQDKLVPTLDRHRRKAKVEEKKRQKDLETRKAKIDAQRRAMGLPEGADIEEGFDPFENQSEDGVEVHGDNKQAVSWTYSQYLDALDREDILNHVDKHTFSSLASKDESLSGSMLDLLKPAPSQDGQSEMGDKLSVTKATDNISRRSSARRSERSKLDAISEEGSQTVNKKSTQAKLSPKDRTNKPSPPSSPPANPVPAIKVQDISGDVKPPVNGRCKANHSSLKNGAGARIIRKISK